MLVALALVAACGSDDGDSGTVDPIDQAADGQADGESDGAADSTDPVQIADGESDGEADETSDETSDGGVDSVASVESADRSAQFRIAVHFGFTSLDPHRATSPAGDSVYQRAVYDTLLAPTLGDDDVVELGPRLATSFDIAPDGLSITFDLRDDVEFHDGTRFDAAAVKANIERAKGPESTVASPLEAVEDVEVIDDTRVVLRLSRPNPAILWTLAGDGTSGMMASPAAFDTDLSVTPVGSGPFTLVSAEPGGEAVYQRWDGHWDPDAALVERLTLSVMPDSNARFNALRSGEYNSAVLTAPHFAEGDQRTADAGGGTGTWAVMLNSSLPPFDDIDVRRAVSMAIDRQAISQTLLHGSPPNDQPFLEGLLGHDPSVAPVPYDPDEARRLVQEAGADGAAITLIQEQVPPNDLLAEAVQQALNEIGLDVRLQPLSVSESRAAWWAGEYEARVGANWAGFPDPSSTLEQVYLALDNPAPPPPELIEMADVAIALPFGSQEREMAYQEISRYLVENPIHAPIARLRQAVVSQPNVIGAEHMFLGAFPFLDFRGIGISTS